MSRIIADSFWKTKSFDHCPQRGEIKNPNNRTYAMYIITCLDNELIYFGILDNFVVEGLYNFDEDNRVRDLTINNPKQYIATCLPLYEDIVLAGADMFTVRLRVCKCCAEVALHHWELGVERTDFTYNSLEIDNFTGIKCIETEEVFPTPG